MAIRPPTQTQSEFLIDIIQTEDDIPVLWGVSAADQKPEVIAHAIDKSWKAIAYVRDLKPEYCKLAVEKDGSAFFLLPKAFQTDDLRSIALRNGLSMRLHEIAKMKSDIKEFKLDYFRQRVKADYQYLLNIESHLQSEDLIEIAFSQSFLTIHSIWNPKPHHFKKAVELDAWALMAISKSDQTDEICLIAINTGLKAHSSGRGSYQCVVELVKKQNEKICLAAVKKDPKNLYHCEYQTEEICMAALDQDVTFLKDIREQSDDICLAAIKKHFSAANLIKGPRSIEFYLQCAEIDGRVLEYVPFEMRSYDICLESVRNNWKALAYVPAKFFSEDLCVEAYNQDIRALQFLWAEVEFDMNLSYGTKVTYNIPDVCTDDQLKLEAFQRERDMTYSLHMQKLELNVNQANTPNRKRNDIV